MLFYPEFPHNQTAAFAICRQLGLRITTDPGRGCVLALAWENQAVREEGGLLRELNEDVRVLNLDCLDIRKSRVEATFLQVFGYPLGVDPTTHHGPFVKKGDGNALKDGTIVEGPIPAREAGFTYQRLVNGEVEPGVLQDIRVPVLSGTIPWAYRKRKRFEDRFRTNWQETLVMEPAALLTDGELNSIARFCAEMGLEFGELDMIRDVDDGQLYIVDVNNTPWGPPRELEEHIRRDLTARLAGLFSDLYLP